MMSVLVIIVGIAFIILALSFLSDWEMGVFFLSALIGSALIAGGIDYYKKDEQLQYTQQQVENVKATYKVQLRNLDTKFMEVQEANMALAIENQALQQQVNQCEQKQELSQDTLSGIKEILEN